MATRRAVFSSLVSHLTRNKKGQIETLQEHRIDASLNNIPLLLVWSEGNNAS